MSKGVFIGGIEIVLAMELPGEARIKLQDLHDDFLHTAVDFDELADGLLSDECLRDPEIVDFWKNKHLRAPVSRLESRLNHLNKDIANWYYELERMQRQAKSMWCERDAVRQELSCQLIDKQLKERRRCCRSH
jgi:uncharacterized protein (DUF3084 family)